MVRLLFAAIPQPVEFCLVGRFFKPSGRMGNPSYQEERFRPQYTDPDATAHGANAGLAATNRYDGKVTRAP